jgi:hypothetical protein
MAVPARLGPGAGDAGDALVERIAAGLLDREPAK